MLRNLKNFYKKGKGTSSNSKEPSSHGRSTIAMNVNRSVAGEASITIGSLRKTRRRWKQPLCSRIRQQLEAQSIQKRFNEEKEVLLFLDFTNCPFVSSKSSKLQPLLENRLDLDSPDSCSGR